MTNPALRQSMRMISAAKRMIVDAAARSVPKTGGRVYRDGPVISVHPLKRNSIKKEAAQDQWVGLPFVVNSQRRVIRLAYRPVGKDITFGGRSIFSASPPTVALSNLWFFAQATYSGTGATAVNRKDPEAAVAGDICDYPTWVNRGFLTSSVSIVAQAAGSVPSGVFNPFDADTDPTLHRQWVDQYSVWGIGVIGSIPTNCPDPDPLPEDWVKPEMLYMRPASVTVRSWLGSVYLNEDGVWTSTVNGLFYDGGEEYQPPGLGNHGFGPYVRVGIGQDGWSAGVSS